MLKLSILIVVLFGVSLAHKYHGYEIHVKHEAPAGRQENEQTGVADGPQEGELTEEQEAGRIADGGQEDSGSGMEMIDTGMIGADQMEGQIQSQGRCEHCQENELEHTYHTYPKYKFEYGVRDFHTGDHKSQWEIRDGDVVKGEYTLTDADGTHRVVKYKADDQSGFQADVRHLGKSFAQQGAQEEGQKGQDDNGLDYGYSYSKLKRFH